MEIDWHNGPRSDLLSTFQLAEGSAELAIGTASNEGVVRIIVATGAGDVGNLRFYQRCGFRMLAVERDAFTPDTGYAESILIDGIELRDRVWFSRDH